MPGDWFRKEHFSSLISSLYDTYHLLEAIVQDAYNLYKENNYEESDEWFEKAQKYIYEVLNKKNSKWRDNALLPVARYFCDTGKYNKAIEILKDIHHGEQTIFLFKRIAEHYIEDNEFEEAEMVVKEAQYTCENAKEKMNAWDQYVPAELALLIFSLGKKDEVEKEIEKIGREHIRIHTLARIAVKNHEKGHKKEAKEQLEALYREALNVTDRWSRKVQSLARLAQAHNRIGNSKVRDEIMGRAIDGMVWSKYANDYDDSLSDIVVAWAEMGELKKALQMLDEVSTNQT